MTVIPAVVTDNGRAKFPQMLGGIVAFSIASYFKVGVGGWIDPGGGPEPRTPDATLSDLDIIENPGNYPSVPAIPTFQKSFTSGDLTFISPSTLQCSCLLDFAEYNSDGSGNPEIWELGIFDAAGTMIAYGTFPMQTKDVSKQIQNIVQITF